MYLSWDRRIKGYDFNGKFYCYTSKFKYNFNWILCMVVFYVIREYIVYIYTQFIVCNYENQGNNNLSLLFYSACNIILLDINYYWSCKEFSLLLAILVFYYDLYSCHKHYYTVVISKFMILRRTKA